MAAVIGRSTDSPVLPEDSSTAFQNHLLSLLSLISQHPSPSFPFPADIEPPNPASDASSLSPYEGKKSQAEEAIERAVIALGERVWNAERTPSPASKEVKPEGKPAADLLTPEWTPPPADTQSSTFCPTCTRPYSDSLTPKNQPLAFSTASSHPLSVSLSTPAAQLPAMRHITFSNHPMPHNILTTSTGASVLTGGAGAAGWSVRGSVEESGMSAEKELELLKAQVQDIARVCKVRLIIGLSISSYRCLKSRP